MSDQKKSELASQLTDTPISARTIAHQTIAYQRSSDMRPKEVLYYQDGQA